jgi:aspartyl-tRNA(Asn)/glutamyl-tRNA(Gln) amidotransferase subunit C
MDKEQVQKIAGLARIELSGEDREKYTGQLGRIIVYIDQLKELDTENIRSMAQPLIDRLTMAEDKAQEFENIRGITGIAPDFRNSFFKVKKVIEA